MKKPLYGQEERDQSYGFNVAPSESLLVLVNNYVKATRFVFWLRENVPNPKEKGVLAKVHEELYGKLRNEYNLASKVAEDRYRNALSVYKSWFNNPKKVPSRLTNGMANAEVEL